MTPPLPSLRPRRDGLSQPTTRNNNRRLHSSNRANLHRKYRPRFDQFRNSVHAASGSVQEVERWNSEVELATLDQSVVHMERSALQIREQKSVVPRLGNIASEKPDGVWRLAYCQLNNMSGSDTRRRKLKDLERISQDFDVDGIAMCELGVNWSSGRGHSLKSWCSPYFSQDIRCTTAHNIHAPRVSLSQPGGTGICLNQSLFEYAHDVEPDFRGLGRWTSWKLYHNPEHVTRIVIAYCPGTGSSDKGLKTVYRQHMNYIHSHHLQRTPYQLFFDDLVFQLKTWRAQNERLILCTDLNEHPLTGKISRRLRSDDIELHECTHHYWPDTTEPNTHIDGSKPIDGIFTTPDIDVTSCLILSFHESVGDHRTTIIEFSTSSAIGRFQGKIVRPQSRRLTLRQPGAVQSYNNTIHQHFATHRIPLRLMALLQEAEKHHGPPSTTFRDKCNVLHKQIAEIRLCAESSCRKILKPALEFSPTVQYWYDRAHAYILLIRIKSGKARRYTDVSRAIRFAARKNIQEPRSLTLEQCMDGLTACRIRQKELRRVSTSLRRRFGQQLIHSAQVSSNKARERAVKERMQRERSSSIWKRINKTTRPPRGRACREVQQNINDHTYTFSTKESVEQQIQQECSTRFHLGHDAPIASTLLGYELQYLQDIHVAYSILMGTYMISPHLDQATQLILREIAKLGKAILTGTQPNTITITGEDYSNYWKRINDRTSSSPSGLHITHYKASALDPVLSEYFANQMNLIISSGIHPLRWGTALQVMLEKVAGVCLVDKLRSIQLYEADLNWFMKFIFNDLAMARLEEANMLPEEHYSKKGSTAEDACFEKTLTFDISRQSRVPMAVISVDAAQCYDRVHPALMSLVWLALTNHPHAVIILLHVLQQMKIFTRTGFGDSSTYFGGPDDVPMCGLGQGSKAAPSSWLQLSSMIVNAYKAQGYASIIRDPVSGELTESIGCMFVDDTDLYCMNPLLLSATLVIIQAQACVSLWSNLLRATGGLIKGAKSFWYLIDYTCSNGKWEYASPDESDNIYLLDFNGNKTPLEKKAPVDAVKTLGVFHSPAGDHTYHLSQLHNRAYEWLNKIRNGQLPSGYVLMSYYQQLWAGLRYGLGALSNSYSSADSCLGKFDYLLLPYIGVNRNIKKEWRTLHCTFGGIGLLSLPIEQFICRTNTLLQHFNSPSIIGRKLTCSIHLLQLQLGTNNNPFLLPFKKYGHLVPPSWTRSFWESYQHFPIQIHLQHEPIPLPRQNDVTVMDFLQRHMPSAAVITSINRCRCYLNLLFLSDIAIADGTTIDHEMIQMYATPRTSRFTFPPEYPTRMDWATWADIWRGALGRHLKLSIPLGEWVHDTHIKWRWYYDPSSDSLIDFSTDRKTIHTKQLKAGVKTRSGGVYSLTTGRFEDDDSTLCPASCIQLPDYGAISQRFSLVAIGPTFSIPSKLPASFWDILEGLGGEWMWRNMHVDLDASVEWFLAALSQQSLVWVTDGSHNPLCAPNISGAGWIVKDCMTNRKWSFSFYEVSDRANSYRAELLGLYAIHTFILALTKYLTIPESATVNVRCDNKGALRTSSRKYKRIRPSSKCADILRCFRTLHSKIRDIHIHYAHVSAHMDDLLSWDELTLEQQLNVQCDTLAKQAVSRASKSHQQGETLPITNLLPLEQCAIFICDKKLPSDITPTLRFECSKIKAREFLCTKRGWSTSQFDQVDWVALDDALSTKTTGFKIWLAKQHSNFCASRVQMHRCKQSDDDKCPSCLTAVETADHLCRCPNEERTQLLSDSTRDLASWLNQNNNTHHELCYWIPHYIQCRGQVRFSDLGPMSPTMYEIALSQDTIGWRNFMEGRISTKIADLQRNHLFTSGSRLSVRSWSSKLISHILHITHTQWIFRNFMLHDKSMGYLRLKECSEAAIQIDTLMHSRPTSIPADSQFLLEFDTERLLAADTDTQHYWLAAMNAALAAKQPYQSPCHQQNQPHPPTLRNTRGLALHTIMRIRKDINSHPSPSSFITSPTAVSGYKQPTFRPTPHSIQQTLPSNKRRKPD